MHSHAIVTVKLIFSSIFYIENINLKKKSIYFLFKYSDIGIKIHKDDISEYYLYFKY